MYCPFDFDKEEYSMSKSSELRYGGISGIILALMLIAAFALDFAISATTQGPPILRPENIGADLLRAKGFTLWIVEAWLYTLMVIPVPLFMVMVYRALREKNDGAVPAVGLFASALFWIFHTLHNVAFLTILQVLVPRYTGGAEGTAIEVVAIALLGFANVTFGFGTSVGALFLVGYLGVLGMVTLQGGGLPRWTGYVALAAALLSLLAYLQFLSEAFGLVFGLPSWVLHIVWVIGATLGLLRSKDTQQV